MLTHHFSVVVDYKQAGLKAPFSFNIIEIVVSELRGVVEVLIESHIRAGSLSAAQLVDLVNAKCLLCVFKISIASCLLRET